MRLPQPTPPEFAALSQCDVVVDGTRVAYTKAGSGPPVLVLHGAVFAGNVFGWETQAALAPHFTTYAPDFPGWGASEKPVGPYDMAHYIRFVGRFLDALGLAQVAIVGHSLGGLVGSAFAVLNPDRVVSLATLAVPPAWAEFGVPPLFQPFLVPVLGELMLGATPWVGADFPLGVRRYYESLFHAPRSIAPERLRAVLQACCEVTADPLHQQAFIRTMRASRQNLVPEVRAALREKLERAAFPMLLVAGRQDPMFAWPLIEAGAQAYPRARLEVIDACGHFPTWEQPDRVAGLLRDFLSA